MKFFVCNYYRPSYSYWCLTLLLFIFPYFLLLFVDGSLRNTRVHYKDWFPTEKGGKGKKSGERRAQFPRPRHKSMYTHTYHLLHSSLCIVRIIALGSSGCCSLADGCDGSSNQNGTILMSLQKLVCRYRSTNQVRMSQRWLEVQDGWPLFFIGWSWGGLSGATRLSRLLFEMGYFRWNFLPRSNPDQLAMQKIDNPCSAVSGKHKWIIRPIILSLRRRAHCE